jgi:hypothetical protein
MYQVFAMTYLVHTTMDNTNGSMERRALKELDEAVVSAIRTHNGQLRGKLTRTTAHA